MKIKILHIAGFFLLLAARCHGAAYGRALQPLEKSTQLIVVTTPDWNAVEGRLVRYERVSPGERWKQVGAVIRIVAGKNGMGWGAGAVSAADLGVRGASGPVKQEGDGKSPAGVFRIGGGFGYAAEAPSGWRLSYTRLTSSVECVDDSASHFYNRIVDRATVSADWHSSEHMAEAGEAYRLGAVIEHNADAVPHAGSCVFLHIWGGPSMGTSGCTAMAPDELEPLLGWIDPAKDPILIQLPVMRYSAAREHLHLPKLPGD